MTTDIWLSPALFYPVKIVGVHVAKGQQVKTGDLLYTLQDAAGVVTQSKSTVSGVFASDPLPLDSTFSTSVPLAQITEQPPEPAPPPPPSPPPAASPKIGPGAYKPSPPKPRPKPQPKRRPSASHDPEAALGFGGFLGYGLALPVFIAIGYVVGEVVDGVGLVGASVFAIVFLFVLMQVAILNLKRSLAGLVASVATVFVLMQPKTVDYENLVTSLLGAASSVKDNVSSGGSWNILGGNAALTSVSPVKRSSALEAGPVSISGCSGDNHLTNYNEYLRRARLAEQACEDAQDCMTWRRSCSQDVSARSGCGDFASCMAQFKEDTYLGVGCTPQWDLATNSCSNDATLYELRNCPGFNAKNASYPDKSFGCVGQQTRALVRESELNQFVDAWVAACSVKRIEKFTCDAIP